MERLWAVLQNRRFRRWIPLGVFLVLPFLLVLPGLGPGRTLYGSDMIVGGFYSRGLVGQALREGHLPVWDGHAMCGYPILAVMQAAIFYPLTWPIMILDPGSFWTATVYVHLALAGAFAFGWLRRGLGVGLGAGLVGACVFMLSGYILSRVQGGHISQICAYPWLAALLWRSERFLAAPTLKRWILLALCVTLLILPGFPQFVFFGALIMFPRLVVHGVRTRREGLRTLALTVASGIAGVLLAAPQLLPTLEMVPEVQRVASNPYEFATQHSLPWSYLVNLIAPDFFGDDTRAVFWGRSPIWEVTGYVGIAGLLLGIFAQGGTHPQRYFWAGAAVFSLLLATGSHGPVFGMFYRIIPGVSLFRCPGRYLTLFTLALAALVAMGFDRWRRPGPELRRPAGLLAIGSAAALGILVLVLLVWRPGDAWRRFVVSEIAQPESLVYDVVRRDLDLPEKAAIQARSSLVRTAVLLALLAICLFAYSRGKIGSRYVSTALGLLLVVDLFLFGRGFFNEYDVGRIAWPEGFVQFMKTRSGSPFRIASPGTENIPLIGKCQLAGLDHVAGYESMVLRRYCELINVISGRPPDEIRIVSSVNTPHAVLDMLGTRFWLLSEGAGIPSGWTPVGRVGNGTLKSIVLETPRAFPRVFVVPQAKVLHSREDRLRTMLDPKTDLRQLVVLEEETTFQTGSPGDPPGTATVVSTSAGAYEIATQTACAGFLVLTESWFPGWEAWIDGVPVGVLRANHCVQAVPLPPGSHTVHFRYHSTWLKAGLLISASLALSTLAIGLLLRYRYTTSGEKR